MWATANGKEVGMATRRPTGRRPGRPTKLGPVERKQVLAVLQVGGSRRDAARVLKVWPTTLQRAMKRDRTFRRQVLRAETLGKLHHLRKLFDHNAWGAHAFFLERRYPEEFARKDKVDITSGGKPLKAFVGVDVERV